jgi:hypothetical protein
VNPQEGMQMLATALERIAVMGAGLMGTYLTLDSIAPTIWTMPGDHVWRGLRLYLRS